MAKVRKIPGWREEETSRKEKEGEGGSREGDGKCQKQCINFFAVYYCGIPVCGYQSTLQMPEPFISECEP